MKRLLDIEFHKFRYSLSSKVVTIIYLSVVFLLPFFGLKEIVAGEFKGTLAEFGIFNFPFVWHLSTYILSWLKFLIAIVIVSLTASEYSNRTLKQNLIDGLSKKELILSKFYFVIIITIAVTLIVFLVSLILGLLNSDYNEIGIIFTDLEYMLAFFISHLTFFSMCLFAGILIKRSAFALGLISVWALFELFIWGMLSILDNIYQLDTWSVVGELLPLSSNYDLIVEPFSKFDAVQSGIELISQEKFEKDYSVPWHNVIISLSWTTLFIYWSFALLKRRDL